MKRLVDILSEITFKTYRGVVRVASSGEMNKMELGELIRALPGVTTTTPIGEDRSGRIFYKVKIITTKSSKEAYESLKQKAIERIPAIRSFEIGYKTLEEL